MREKLLVCIITSVAFLISCGDGNVIVPTDPAVQREKDSLEIIDYFILNDYPITEETVTPSGVRFVILDEGSGAMIEESDIITFDYTGKLLSDTIFDTSIEHVADSIREAVEADTVGKPVSEVSLQIDILAVFNEDRTYRPLVETYSKSGWPMQGSYIRGFQDGISASFGSMKIGGNVLIVIPSGEAYGTSGSAPLIEPNSVIAFELYPREITKQQ